MYHIHVEFDDGDGAPRRDALRDFGFDDSFLRDYSQRAETGDLPARVVEVQRGRYGAITRGIDGGLVEIEAIASGRLSYETASGAELPAVGDWVVVRANPNGPAAIKSVLPRKTVFKRKAPGDAEYDRVEAQVLAANVDTAFIVTAAGHDFNLRRIERYLALARESGVEPVLVVTKSDLAEDPDSLVAQANALGRGLSCFGVCAPEGKGLERFAPWLEPGRTIVLLGSSGAGKSTLLNALADEKLAKTKEVRADDQRGRHTTTHRELFKLASGALIIDSPGMRELQLWASEETVDASFEDIAELAAACRFGDCAHAAEPGCAVRAALESGELSAARYASYKKLMREAAYLAMREDSSLERAEAQKWKAINKSMRGYSKERRSIQGKSR